MKLSFGIENIRRIGSTPQIEMRPITVLVGRNSAGKSTFLRSLPLIRQSLETRSSAPILWYGDLVDFGDPIVAIGERETKKQAAFRFTLSDIREEKRRSPYYFYAGYYRQRTPVRVDTVSVRYIIGVQEEQTVLQSIEVEIPEEGIDVRLDFASTAGASGKITIGGTLADILPKAYEVRRVDRNLFSPPLVIPRSLINEERGMRWPMRSADILAEALVDTFRQQITRNLSEKTYQREAWRILSEERLDSATLKRLRSTSSTATFRAVYDQLLSSEDNRVRQKTTSIHNLSRVFSVLEVIEDQLMAYFLNIGYLEPVRAASERFYRKQELEVAEIAPNGANFPMFLLITYQAHPAQK